MALKDGRCPNCGSIVHLESSAQRGHCLFCDMVFDNATAFSIAANPQGVVFPNETQPPYEGPSLDVRANGIAVKSSQKQVQPPPKKANIPAYVIKENKLPDLKLSGKTKLKFYGAAIGLIAIIVAIALPLTISRDEARAKLLAALPALSSAFTIDPAANATIRYQGNDYVLIATGEPVTKPAAIAFFKAYCEKRAEILNIDLNSDAVYSQVTIKLATPDGGWLISQPQNAAALASGEGVIALTK